MINFNGTLSSNPNFLSADNRSFLYGDGVFESIRISEGKPCFAEDHYFRLMASLRMLRMEIPMFFTLEYFEEELIKTFEANPGSNFLRFVAYRKEGGLYTPESSDIDFLVTAQNRTYRLKERFEIGVFKDFFLNPSFLGSIKSTQKLEYVLASVFAKENDWDASLMLNGNKGVVSTNLGNIYCVKGSEISTPPLGSGALNGIVRKQLKVLLEKNKDLTFVEKDFNPFDLQRADEVFVTNVNTLLQPVTNYKKKVFKTDIALELRSQIENLI